MDSKALAKVADNLYIIEIDKNKKVSFLSQALCTYLKTDLESFIKNNPIVVEQISNAKNSDIIHITPKDQLPHFFGVTKLHINENNVYILNDITESMKSGNGSTIVENDDHHKRLHMAVTAARLGIWDWDLVNDVLTWDDSMYELYGLDKNDFTGAYDAWTKSLFPDDKANAEREVRLALSGDLDFDTHFRIIKPTGDIRHIRARGEVFRDEHGNPTRMIGSNWDVTEEFKTHALLEKVSEKAKEAAEAKSKFLAKMSHEIRTPMNGILGMTQILKRTELNDEQEKFVNNLADSSERLLTVLNDILDFSKIEAGNFEILKAEFNLRKCIEAVGTILKPLALAKNLHFEYRLDNNVPEKIIQDETRLRQVLLNILNNAVKYTKEGSISLLVTRNDDQLKFITKDTGIGISKKNLTKIFNPFEQAQEYSTTTEDGTGLGLSISNTLVNMMGGDIQVESKVHVGSTFTFTIQLGKIDEQTPKTKKPKIKLDHPDKLEDFEVLVVEDNQMNQLVSKQMLKQIGITRVDIAEDGLVGVNMAVEKQYDLILMDIQMPVMDGIVATETITNALADTDYLPYIAAMTANIFEDDLKKYEQAGFRSVIAKPAHFEDLIKIINEILESPS